MKKLFIVESPGKAKTIKKYLDADFIVTSTMGHIKDLPQKTLGIEINPPELMIEYTVMEGKEKVIKELKKYISEADEIYLAPDADREGEIIAFHINQIINEQKKKKVIYRVTYNEVSKKAILDCFNHKREINANMVAAQQARRVLDRLVGYKVSPVLWRKLTKGLSAGRVQSVALKLICVREDEIKKFIIEEYWTIHGTIKDSQIIVDIFDKNKKKEHLSQEEVDAIILHNKKNEWKVITTKDREKKRKPYPPFVTSTLQQAAYNILRYNVQKTMQCAQQLYEGVVFEDDANPIALITYMRTDSTRIADDALVQVRDYIKQSYGADYTPKHAIVYAAKKDAQDAHEAIRPIDPSITPESIQHKVKKEIYEIYNLIWKRYIACQMSEAIYTTRSITLESGNLEGKLTGSTIKFDGFLKVYNNKEEDDETESKKLPPNLAEGSTVIIEELYGKQHFTQPPSRYSEATLVKELEEKGIGRPSTYVPIVRTIMDRLYTNLDSNNRFTPTKLGYDVYLMLEQHMPTIMDYSFTAQMEEKLDSIAQGNLTRNKLIFDFYDYLIPAVEKFLSEKITKQYEIIDHKCPECDGSLAIKWSKIGEFIGCMKYPECKFTAKFKRLDTNKIELLVAEDKEKNDNELDIKCESCQKPMVKKIGKFGEFIACSGYPQCNYVLQEKTKHLCPACQQAPLSKKTWKGKIFWGCGSYPKCKFAINGNLIEQQCPTCKYNFAKFDGTCLNKECPTHKKDSE
jgi:DNA topoisomerase-1